MDASPDPRTVRRVTVEPSMPEPSDCVPPGEDVETNVAISGGWLAVTDRQVLVYRDDREPPLAFVARPNVAGVAVRRSGDGPVFRYAPRIAVYGLLSVLVGLLFSSLIAPASVDIPTDSRAAGALGFVTLLTDGLRLLSDAAILFGAVALVGALGALGYRLASGERVLTVQLADGSAVQCEATAGGARRALRQLEASLSERSGTDQAGAATAEPSGAADRDREATD